MIKNKAKLLLRLTSACLTVALLYFVVSYGSGLISEADFSFQNGQYVSLLGAVLCFLIFYSLLSVHWYMSCRLMDDDTSRRQALAFFASQPYKYLPTSIFTFSFRAKFSRQLGVSVKKSTYAQAVENASIVGTGLIVGGIFYILESSPYFGIAVSAIVAGFLYIAWRSKATIVIPVVKKKASFENLVPMLALSCVAWLFAGLSFWLTAHSLGYSASIWAMVSINALSYSVGIIAFFAPGGIGVREVILLSGGVHTPTVVLWRILTLGIDIVTGIIAAIIIRSTRGGSRKGVSKDA